MELLVFYISKEALINRLHERIASLRVMRFLKRFSGM